MVGARLENNTVGGLSSERDALPAEETHGGRLRCATTRCFSAKIDGRICHRKRPSVTSCDNHWRDTSNVVIHRQPPATRLSSTSPSHSGDPSVDASETNGTFDKLLPNLDNNMIIFPPGNVGSNRIVVAGEWEVSCWTVLEWWSGCRKMLEGGVGAKRYFLVEPEEKGREAHNEKFQPKAAGQSPKPPAKHNRIVGKAVGTQVKGRGKSSSTDNKSRRGNRQSGRNAASPSLLSSPGDGRNGISIGRES
ncbi:hypothetical protein KSP40_PGU003374 [Platanthera guangdongensis]|uniref:Uncharacterized protein n=1 Tax=Platanthera guangdongensis TaxID=2320717 RepID=A0ABR2MP80_9ASPA